MPVILELEDYEANLVVDALVEQRIRLMKNWENRYRSPDEADGRYGIDIGKIGDLAHIDADIEAVADIRERLKEGIMWQRFCQERSVDPETKVSVAWHHERGWLPSADFIEKPIEGSLDQDQVSPGTWTTLPEGFDVDDLMFDVTDPEDQIVIASGDTQTDGTVVGFHTFPTEADNAVSKGIWALITRNFSLASVRDMELAEKALKADPERLAAIKSSVEGLQKALAEDGKASIYLQVGGVCRELYGHADAVEQLLRQLELGTRLQSDCIRRDEAGRAYLDPSATVS